MAALSAICCNPDMAAKHRRLVADGKPGKVTLVAVMRKLLLLANVLLRDDRLRTLGAGGQRKTPPGPPVPPPAERGCRPWRQGAELRKLA